MPATADTCMNSKWVFPTTSSYLHIAKYKNNSSTKSYARKIFNKVLKQNYM